MPSPRSCSWEHLLDTDPVAEERLAIGATDHGFLALSFSSGRWRRAQPLVLARHEIDPASRVTLQGGFRGLFGLNDQSESREQGDRQAQGR
jgi:hypothetical protein